MVYGSPALYGSMAEHFARSRENVFRPPRQQYGQGRGAGCRRVALKKLLSPASLDPASKYTALGVFEVVWCEGTFQVFGHFIGDKNCHIARKNR